MDGRGQGRAGLTVRLSWARFALVRNRPDMKHAMSDERDLIAALEVDLALIHTVTG
jgi:hypothetical protein